GIGRGQVKSPRGSIKTLRYRFLILVTQAQVQSQFGGDLPIVLHEQALKNLLIGLGIVAVYVATRRLAQQEGGQTLSSRDDASVILFCEIIVKGIVAEGIAHIRLILTIDAEVITETQSMSSQDLGERRQKGVDVVDEKSPAKGCMAIEVVGQTTKPIN